MYVNILNVFGLPIMSDMNPQKNLPDKLPIVKISKKLVVFVDVTF